MVLGLSTPPSMIDHVNSRHRVKQWMADSTLWHHSSFQKHFFRYFHDKTMLKVQRFLFLQTNLNMIHQAIHATVNLKKEGIVVGKVEVMANCRKKPRQIVELSGQPSQGLILSLWLPLLLSAIYATPFRACVSLYKCQTRVGFEFKKGGNSCGKSGSHGQL